MVTDSPDYTKKITLDVSGVLTGLEELARRLGAYPDGKLGGFLVWQDGFEGTAAAWVLDAVPEGSECMRTTEMAFEGGASLIMSVAASEGGGCSATRYFAHAGAVTLAISAMIAWDQGLGELNILFIDHQSDVTKYARITYDLAAKLLTYRDGDLGEQVIASNLDYTPLALTFYPIRLDVDLSTRCYKRLYFADKVYNLEGKPFYLGDTPAEPYSAIQYEVTTLTGDSFTVYLDNVAVVREMLSLGGTAPEMGSPPPPEG